MAGLLPATLCGCHRSLLGRARAMSNTRIFHVLSVAAMAFLLPPAHGSAAEETPAVGSKTDRGRTFLLREPVEMYWNDWSGVRVSDDGAGQVDVYIAGEGKTVVFDGVVSLNCESETEYYWRIAGDSGQALSEEEVDAKVPPRVIVNARAIFCKG
jgi:hypothetical protein